MKKVFKTRCKIEEDFVLLKVFLEQVLHHLIVLKQQYSEVITARLIIFLLKVLIWVDLVWASLVSHSNLLTPSVIIIFSYLLWLLFLFNFFIHILAASILYEPHRLLTVVVLLLWIIVLWRLVTFCVDWYLNNKHCALAQFRHNRDLSPHHAH